MAARQSKVQFVVRREVLDALAMVGQSLAEGKPLSLVLEQLVQSAGEALAADSIVLYQFHPKTGTLVIPPVVWGKLQLEPLLNAPLSREALVFKVLGRKKPYYAPDAPTDWGKLIKSSAKGVTSQWFIQREGIISSAGLPLRAGGLQLGALFVNFRRTCNFEAVERDLIELFASHAVVALHNAQLLEVERRTARQVSMAISSEDGLEQTAGKILDELGKVIGYRKATMQLIREDNRSLLAFRGFNADEVDQELLRPISEDDLIRRVVAGSGPYILSDPRQDPAWEIRSQTKNVHSWVGVPLRFAGRLVGLITLDHDQAGFYTSAFEDTLIWFAGQAAIAVENARLHADAQRRIRDLKILNEIAEIMSSQLNTHDLLDTIVSRIQDHLMCTHCTVFSPRLVDDTLLLAPEVIVGEHAERIRSRQFKSGEGLVGWVYQTGKPLLLADARSDAHYAPARERQEGPRSMIVVPVQVGSQTVRVISADQDAYGWFNESDLHFMQALARQAGIAFQRNLGMEVVGEVGRQINSAANVDEILKMIVKFAIKLSDVTSGVIYLVSADGSRIAKSYKYPRNSFHPAPRMEKEDGLTRQVIAKRQVLRFVDVPQDERVNPQLRGRVCSMIALPLEHDNRITGVLFLNDRITHDFTDTEISLLKTLANQAATAIHKASLLDGLKRQVRMHRMLNRIGIELIGLRDESEVFQAVVRAVIKTLACRHCTVFRVEQENLVVVASQGKLQKQVPIGRNFPLNKGVAGWVARTGKLALVPDTTQNNFFDSSWSDPPPKSLVIAPILLEGKVYGVISAEDVQSMAFDKQDQTLMASFALQVSQAIGIAQRINELEALNRAGRAITSELDLDVLLETLLETVKLTFSCLSATLFTLGPDNTLVAHKRQGPAREEFENLQFKSGEGLAGWVAEHRCSQNVPDVRKDPRFIQPSSIPAEAPHSILLAPMLFKDRLVGVISIDKEIVGGFSTEDQRLLETLASQAAVAYENARLLQELRRQAEELGLLHDVSTRLMTLDFKRLLGMIIDGAMRLTKTEIGVIYLLDESGEHIVESLSQPEDFSPATFDLKISGITRHIFENRKPVYIPDVDLDPRVSQQIKDAKIRSFIGIPIMSGDTVIGVLYLNDREQHSFSPEEINLGVTLASQAAVAIENARSFEQRKNSTDAFMRIVQIVNTIGAEEDPLPIILEKVISLFQGRFVHYGSFALVDQKNKRLAYQAIFENNVVIPKSQLPSDRSTRDWNIGITGQVAREGLPFRFGDVRHEKGHYHSRLDTVSKMIVPLITHLHQIIGILELESTERGAFSKDDLDLCEGVAKVAAIAIEKGGLYQDLVRRVSHLDALSQVAKQVSNLPAEQEILDRVVQAARETLQAVRCTLFVFDHSGLLVPKAATGIAPEALRELVFHPGVGLAGWVAQTGRSYETADANQDERFLPDQYSLPDRSRPMILAPLWVEGKVAGVLSADRDNDQPFDQDDLRFLEILAVEAGIFLLRRRRMEAISRRFNPYTVGYPIRDPQGFFGRKKLIQEILSGLPKNSFIVYGERRIGKTSLLFQLENQLNLLSGTDEEFFFLPVYYSVQGVTEEHFFGFLARQVQLATQVSPQKSPEDVFDVLDLQGYLESVNLKMAERSPGRPLRIVFLLDEMEVFQNYSPDLHDRFRNLFMTNCGNYLRMVIAGLNLQLVTSIASPWYNISQIQELLPLDNEEALDLITTPVAGYYSYDPTALQKILETSDYKPIELQRLGSLSVNTLLNRLSATDDSQELQRNEYCIGIQDVEKAIQQTLHDKDPEYRDFWVGLDREQQNILRKAAKAGGWLSDPELFSRERHYNLTCSEAGKLRLTRLFMMWMGWMKA